MRIHPKGESLGHEWLVAAVFLSAISVGATATQSREPTTPTTPFALVQPARRSSDAPLMPPEPLPPAAHRITPMAFDIVVRSRSQAGASTITRQRVTRTAERIHIDDGAGREWLFERNPVDPRRVSGSAIYHAAREIVVYQESEVRNTLGISGWADVLMPGIRAGQIREMKPTRQARTIGGLRFVRFTALDPRGATKEAWWNEDEVLSAGVVSSSGAMSVEMSLERLIAVVQPELLRAPAMRFPSYRQIDFPDSLERH
ncbi:MAG: hypothetical protein GEU82_01635 [Luteitalea sp.]|nr:hypothetical protein [Luteitalea sp.]